ncbi:MAG: hypothetical protein U9R29_03020, partial [Thermodesulfobacteriota bacterium]|nr:hypothetical protein [Thermodesulfobacteriota bacterium]
CQRFAAILTNDRRMTRGYGWSLAFTIQGLSPFAFYRLLPALSQRPLGFSFSLKPISDFGKCYPLDLL